MGDGVTDEREEDGLKREEGGDRQREGVDQQLKREGVTDNKEEGRG